MKKIFLLILFVIIASSCGGSGGGGGSTTFTVGGTISGLTAAGLVLQNNTADDLTITSGSTSFSFVTGLATGATYQVTIKTQPTGETRSLSSGTGTIASANITSVALTCSTTKDLTFVVDSGLILDNASAPNVGYDSDTGINILFYQDMHDNFTYTATSTDGLTFSDATRIGDSTSYAHHSRYMYMSDGCYRTFLTHSATDYTVVSLSWSASGGALHRLLMTELAIHRIPPTTAL